MSLEIGKIERPAAKGYRKSKFALLVGFSMQRKKAGTGEIEQWTGNGRERRRLIKTAEGSAGNPIEFWNA
jgi:hypothetical protein